MHLRRPRRIFRSSLPRPSRGSSTFGSGGRRSRSGAWLIGIGGTTLAFVALGAFVAAGTLFPAGPQNDASSRPAPADRLAADASDIAIVDGSTLRLAEHVVRLIGIETPDRGQACQIPAAASGTAVDCSTASTAALAALVRSRTVTCDIHDSDAMGRPLGICVAGGTELNRALVAGGWARVGDATELTEDRVRMLRKAETIARAEHRGLWTRLASSTDGNSANSGAATW